MDVPRNFEVVNCPACGGGDFAVDRQTRDWILPTGLTLQIVRCSACGLHYTNPRPLLSHLGEYYPTDYSPHRRGHGELDKAAGIGGAVRLLILRSAYAAPALRPRGAQRLLAGLLSLVKRPASCGFALPYHGRGRLLDFGCGNGKFLRRMHALGWDVTGLDFSETAVQAVRASGLKAHQGSLPHPALALRSFDLISMRHSLEHVPDPKPVLAAARELLDDGGLLLVEVPNYASWEVEHFGEASPCLDLPRHLLHFTPQTLADLLTRCGFRVRSVAQSSQSDGIRKALAQVERRGSRRGDFLLRCKPIRQLAGWWCQRRGRGSELLALAERVDGA